MLVPSLCTMDALTFELTDPHDDVTRPRLTESLQSRNSVRQMMFQVYSKSCNQPSHSPSIKVAFLELNPLSLSIVDAFFKSTLQQLDNQTISADALIGEQNEQLPESEEWILYHRAAMERLEKITKVQQQQVKQKTRLTCEQFAVV